MKKINYIILMLLILTTFTFADNVKNCEAKLNPVVATGTFGIPSGLSEKGNDVYFDFDTNKKFIVKKEEKAPADWDFLITYILKEVKMGPMGTHTVPFLDASVNADKNCSYYMIEDSFENVKSVDKSLFKSAGWKGYGHRDFKDNKKLKKEKYKNGFPFLCYDWYEMVKMTKFKYQAYEGRVFIIKSSDSKYYKVKFTEVNGNYDDNGKEKLYQIKLKYALIK